MNKIEQFVPEIKQNITVGQQKIRNRIKLKGIVSLIETDDRMDGTLGGWHHVAAILVETNYTKQPASLHEINRITITFITIITFGEIEQHARLTASVNKRQESTSFINMVIVTY